MDFNLNNYLEFIEKEIKLVLLKNNKTNLTFDIFDYENDENKLLFLKRKQYQMKIGQIIQIILGNYKDFENLKQGHESGLDIISKKRKIIIELKNRTTTDNYSSRLTNLNKLYKFKKENPEYLCIYGCLNDTTKEKTETGKIESILINNLEVKKYIGNELLNLILKEDKDIIINFVKKIIHDYMNNKHQEF